MRFTKQGGQILSSLEGSDFASQNKEDSMRTNWLDYTLLSLVIIGAVNWGLIGFFNFDLVAFLFGEMSWLSRIVYSLVGISGLYTCSLFGRIRSYGE